MHKNTQIIEAGTLSHITVPTVHQYISYDLTVHIQQSHQHPISSPFQLWLDCCDYEGMGSYAFIPEREGERDRERKDGRERGFPKCWSQ